MVTADGRRVLVDPKNPNCRATQTRPRFDLLKDPKEPLAVDIEFQEYRPKDAEKWAHRIGRIAFVNTRGDTIYDTYCRYEYDETISVKMPPAMFGVTYKDLRLANGAKPIREVNEDLSKIMYQRTIVGHGMRLDYLAIDQELWKDVNKVDTQGIYGQRALSTLSSELLGISIQGQYHDPSEDANATMLLYLRRYPYNGRTNFEDAPFIYDEEDFPALGAPAKPTKRKAPSCEPSKKKVPSREHSDW